jgi:peptide/nickel transport system ATP-binding protein
MSSDIVEPPTSTSIIEVAHVDVEFPSRTAGLLRRAKVHAVTDATLRVVPGEIVGIVGESGCGKSTLASVLMGRIRPTRGHVRYRGEDIWSLRPADRRRRFGQAIGVVFQDPGGALNPRMPIRDILRDPLDVHRRGPRSEREARVRELCRLVGLPLSVLDVRPSQLSGGQKQRVAIARALALEPEVLIADEPTSALDVSVRAQILNLLSDLRVRLGLAIVFISHDIQTVRYLSDRVAVMYLGRVVETGPAVDVDTAPRHPYTAALLSAAPSLLDPRERIVLEGRVPSAENPPSGCPFRTRCWKADDICAEAFPAATTADSHRWHCVHALTPDEHVHLGASTSRLPPPHARPQPAASPDTHLHDRS